MSLPAVRLKKKHDRRVASGHPWVFSNEIDGDVKALPIGGAVEVYDGRGKHLGRGLANPNALVAVRLLTRRKDDLDHPAFWTWRLREAAALRAQLYPDRTSLRLVNGEGDGLPGLVVDRLGDRLVVRLTTPGTEQRKALLKEALTTVFEPAGAFLRSTGKEREQEGLPHEAGRWWGPEDPITRFEDEGVQYVVDLEGVPHGFDQADNRARAARLCAGRTVLDVYSGDGAFALAALAGGARAAVAVDKKTACAEAVATNAEANGWTDRLDVVKAEGRAFLQAQLGRSAQYGAVILDPPPFARSRKDATDALRGYRELNAIALGLVEPGGLLFTTTRSEPVRADRFLEAIRQAATDAGRRLSLLHQGAASPDHPLDPALADHTRLQHLVFRVQLA